MMLAPSTELRSVAQFRILVGMVSGNLIAGGASALSKWFLVSISGSSSNFKWRLWRATRGPTIAIAKPSNPTHGQVQLLPRSKGVGSVRHRYVTRVTRSHKLNDRDHAGIADGTAAPEAHLPRYFAKHGHIDADPKKTKKDGGGKGNWGRSGEEVHDYGYTFTNARRRSNSSTQGLAEFKTKFETVEPDPVFEEEIHGPLHEDINGVDGIGVKSNESSTSGTSEAEIEVKKA
ncbi:hypothetical protein RJZ56_004113 [Blastomyces dermatitidis]